MDINQIDEDDMEEMDIKWNMALLSIRADKFWKRTGKKISIQGSDVAGFDKSKVESFNYHKMGHFARECRAPRSQERGRKESYRQGSKAKEKTPKALLDIDGVGWDWSYMANEGEDHALVADAEAPTEFALMANTKIMVFNNSLSSNDYKKNRIVSRILLKIDEDDMEEMDIKWNMALLSMRADKFWKRTGKKINIQGSDVTGFDKSKVECFNCHKMGHFARECRALN
nr:ribonuclease H-like domain-containing protein [Tanacetum cinerariifolium]